MANVALAVVRGGVNGSSNQTSPLRGRAGITKRERAHIRRTLLARAPLLVHMAAQVVDCATGPDPESGLAFLDILVEECAAVRRAATRR